VLPRPTKLQFKELMRSIENEEKSKIDKLRPFTFADFRSGDIVEFKYLHSLSEGKGNSYTGTIIGRSRRNTYNATFRVLFRFCGVQVEMNVKQFSPMLANFRLVAKGSGNLRSKLFYLNKMNLTKEELMRPIIKRAAKGRKEEKLIKFAHRTPKNYTFDLTKDPVLPIKVQ